MDESSLPGHVEMNFQPGLVSVVIINFNSGAYIARCIETIEAQSYTPLEILVIDNGSSDGSLSMLEGIAQEGRLRLFPGTNVGFAKANNIGIHASAGEFILTLNADAFLSADYIGRCVEAFRRNDLLGTVVGKLVSDSDPSIIDSAGIYFYREGVAAERGFGEKDRGQYDRQEFVDGACAAAAVYRRAMLEDIRIGDEFYDEAFFAFVEDVDVSFRSGMRGWTTLYLPSAIVRHVRGGSSGQLKEFTFYLNERNSRLFLRKGFALVARPSDKVLQTILLLGRNVSKFRNLSAGLRKRLKKEMPELRRAMDRKRECVRNPDRPPAFDITGRKSYVWASVLRRVGVAR